MLGKKINGFELIRLLGVGGMAEVWYAENEIHKPAAVKVLNPELSRNASIVERFRNEAEIMVRLDHHNIRQVYGYGLIDERPAIVMEYLNGADLAARMNQGQRFTNEELIKWWNQLVDALQYTHEEGIVHRDIKPANIFVDNRGNIKLLDFGIAKIRESISLTHTGTFMGTLLYMSPEQIKDSKHIDYHTDIYSLAVTFVHLLTGQKPYDETTTSNFDIQLSIVTKPLDLSGVPEQWRAFLEPYLNKEAEQRPDLRFFNATQPVTPVSPKPTTPNRPAETPVSAGKTTINEKPYNIDEIHKENEPKKTFLGYDKKEWKKKGLIWLGLTMFYLLLLNMSEQIIFHYQVTADYIGWTNIYVKGVFWFVVFSVSIWLFEWLIKKWKIKNDVILKVTIGIIVLSLILFFVGGFYLIRLWYLFAAMSLATMFVCISERFKVIPYIVFSIMIVLFTCWVRYRAFCAIFDGWFIDNLMYENGWYGIFRMSFPLFAFLPMFTLLVVMIVRKVKEKKAAKTV